MVATTSVYAPSYHNDVHVCALTVLYHIHYVNSGIRRHFLIDGYVIFSSLRHTIYYPWNMISAYDLCISIYYSFVSTLYPVLSPPVSTLDLILPPSISTLNPISSFFNLT